MSSIMKILYVDCDEKLCSRILEEATAEFRNHNIYCAFTVVCNGFVALECFEHTQYDLLIIDKNLTDDLDGSRLLRFIRDTGSETPAIMLSAGTIVADETDISFVATLPKPFTVMALLRCISDVFNLAITFVNTETEIEGANNGTADSDLH